MAFVWNRGKTEAMSIAENHNLVRIFQVQGGTLFILNKGNKNSLYRVNWKGQGAEKQIESLDPQLVVEQVVEKSGVKYLRVPPGDRQQTLFLRGTQVKGRLLRDDGYLQTGESLSLPDGIGGLLELNYQPGVFTVWQSSPTEKEMVYMGEKASGFIESINQGRGTLENKSQLWKFDLQDPSYIIVDANTPGVTALLKEGKIQVVKAGFKPADRQLIYFLEPGQYQFWTRPLNGINQKGTLKLRKMIPITIGEQEGPIRRRLIQSGEIQLFRFRVAQTATVGVGVAAEQDLLTTQLFDSNFKKVGEGPLIFKQLKAGSYLLTIKTHQDNSPPVSYRPILLGHQGSKQGVPEQTKRQYTENQ